MSHKNIGNKTLRLVGHVKLLSWGVMQISLGRPWHFERHHAVRVLFQPLGPISR